MLNTKNRKGKEFQGMRTVKSTSMKNAMFLASWNFVTPIVVVIDGGRAGPVPEQEPLAKQQELNQRKAVGELHFRMKLLPYLRQIHAY
jgi:hypothetical protein